MDIHHELRAECQSIADGEPDPGGSATAAPFRATPAEQRYAAAQAAADRAAARVADLEEQLLAAREALTLASVERRNAYAALPVALRGAA